MEYRRGPCVCGLAACGPNCDCDCHAYDAYSCAAILTGVKFYFPRIAVGELAGVGRNELFRWMQHNVKALHAHLPTYLHTAGFGDEEISEDEYMTVPADISRRTGELEEGGCNVPEKRRASPTPSISFYQAPCASLCGALNLDPALVIARLAPKAKRGIDPIFAAKSISKRAPQRASNARP